jgi:hypothetical protein
MKSVNAQRGLQVELDLPSKNLRIGNARTLGDHHVHLTTHVLRHGASAALQLLEHGLALIDESAELGTSWLVRVGEDELLASGDVGTTTSERDGREGLDVQVASLGAALDELSSKREDSTRAKWCIKSIRYWNSFAGSANEGLMAGLNGDNLSGGGQNGRVLDKWCGSEIGRDTDSLENAGGGNHTSGVVEVEVVGTFLYWLATKGSDGGCQLRDMGVLSRCDLLKSSNLIGAETERLEVSVWEFGEALLVEGRFKVL